MKRKCVLVTGASGFLGAHVVSLLRAKHFDVRTIGRGRAPHTGITHTRADLSRAVSKNVVRRVDAIVHLASDVNIARSIEHPEEHIQHNLSLTLNLLEACRGAGVKPLIIYLSSDRVYGKARGTVTEQSPTFPIEPYVASKLMSETVLATYANQFAIPYIALRASAFFGPHQPRRGFISDVIQKMIEGDEIRVGPLTGVKNFTYASNVADAVHAALVAPQRSHNRVYNIGGKPVSLSEVLQLLKTIIENRLNKQIRIRTDRSIRLPAQNEIGPFRLSCSAARTALHWKEVVPLREGLERTVDYFLNTPRNT